MVGAKLVEPRLAPRAVVEITDPSSLETLSTPALDLDRDRLDRNIERLTALMTTHCVTLRPLLKSEVDRRRKSGFCAKYSVSASVDTVMGPGWRRPRLRILKSDDDKPLTTASAWRHLGEAPQQE